MIDWFLNNWPVREDGEPEEEVFLTNENDLPSGADICCSYLSSCGIPYITRVPAAGQIGSVYAGVSPVGRDIYVPESFLKDAQELLSEAEDFAFDHNYEEDLLL